MRFAGPVPGLRGRARRSGSRASPAQVEAEEYTPKVNVTPNAVALKDD